MLKNYLKITLRSFLRNKLYASINLLGLSVGIASFILVYLFVQNQLSYDQGYTDAQRIYRVINHIHFNDKEELTEWTSALLAARVQKDYPEVERASSYYAESGVLINQKKRIRQKEIGVASQGLIDIFQFKFLTGNPSKGLTAPHSVVLTQSTANKLFGDYQKAYNQTITSGDGKKLQVTGVIQDLPVNTHLKFESLVSMEMLKNESLNEWRNNGLITYLKLKANTNPQVFKKKLDELTKELLKAKIYSEKHYKKYTLQALTDIHLYPYSDESEANIKYVYIFSAIGLFILLIACINYMNMATSGAINRAKEVGIRKVVGSNRKQLIQQFLFESIVLVGLAVLLGLALVEMALPWFNNITLLDLSLPLSQWQTWVAVAGLIGLVSFMSGIYPAFFLSAFNTLKVLKGKFSRNQRTANLRRALVVFQFMLSIIVLISTWISFEQFRFMQKKDLGFTKEQVYVVPLESADATKKINQLKETLQKNPKVKGLAMASSTPGTQTWGNNIFQYKEKGENKSQAADFFMVEKNYFDLMQMKTRKGALYVPMSEKDSSYSVVVNETFVKKAGWDINSLEEAKNPIGKIINRRLKIVGVVKDLHIRSLHHKIDPLLMLVVPKMKRGQYLYMKLRPEDMSHTLAAVKTSYQKVESKYPFSGFFLDQHFAKEYRQDKASLQIFSTFSGIAILIACLGLFSLAAFTIGQRTKEIGIRKILGASVRQILQLVTRDFVTLIVIAVVIALPLVYYFSQQWLAQFAYQTNINYAITFALAVALVILVALSTISLHAFKAVNVNPTEVLKDE